MLITLQQLKSALQAVKSYITSVTPTKTSDLTNDSGFITNAGVTSYNGATGAVTSPWVDGTGTNSAKSRTASSASGANSVAEGGGTTASNDQAHAEGGGTTASGVNSHAEGAGSVASGSGSHAENSGRAIGYYSHAEGGGTEASGDYSHTQGSGTTASGYASHAEGGATQAGGQWSHSEGGSTIAASNYQHVQGKYNVSDTNGTYAHIVGGGTSNSNRLNIHTLDWNGNAVYSGKVTVGTAPSANMDVATKQYVDTAVSSVESPPEIFIGSTTPSGYTMYIDPEGMVENARGVSF